MNNAIRTAGLCERAARKPKEAVVRKTTKQKGKQKAKGGADASEEVDETSSGCHGGGEIMDPGEKLVAALNVFMQWYAKDVYHGNVRDLNKWNRISKEISRKVFSVMLRLPWFESFYPLHTFEELYHGLPRLRKSFQGYLVFRFGLIDKDLRYLTSQPALDLSRQRGISGNGFVHLVSLQRLNAAMCIQLTDEDFDMIPTENLSSLSIHACGNLDLTDNAFKRWKHIQRLNMRLCDQITITDGAFRHLQSLSHLDISGCHQRSITDAAFSNLPKLSSLNMSDCVQFTDDAFTHFHNLTHLNMNGCNQTCISDKAFEHLENLVTLKVQGCNQSTITEAAFTHLGTFCTVTSSQVAYNLKNANYATDQWHSPN
eukprot:gb/GECG01010983.1/.p1 GENE.gb/GECG01010983.1/~~gb/GECG01010983.1/.p1  ORF type:complete len:371 (+),score=44.74 gb/GECG01010983.1/:1-1113(+)